MKKIKELLTVAICALLVISPVMTETVSAAGMKESVADFTSGMRSGWVTTANGRKYRRNGKFVKGCQKVGMNYYFFNANGVLQRKNVTSAGKTYYIENNGHVQGIKKGSRYLSPSGKKLNREQLNDLKAYQNARRIVNGVTTSGMSKTQKLKVCYRWMKCNGLGAWRTLSEGGDAWCAINANDLFERRSGNCISYACAMAYIAKVIGYRNVYVCSRASRKDNLHTWTEINGRVYDSYFGKRRGMNRYCGIKYSQYDYKAAFRKKIA